jgi:hypothetical protein
MLRAMAAESNTVILNWKLGGEGEGKFGVGDQVQSRIGRKFQYNTVEGNQRERWN